MLNKKKCILVIIIITIFVTGKIIKNPDDMPVNIFKIHSDQVEISRVICSESLLYDIKDMFLVGSTIINRTKSEDFPPSIQGVVRQPGQYQGITNPRKKNKFDPICNTVATLVYWSVGINDKVLYFSNLPESTDKKQINKLKASLPHACSSYHCFWGELKK